MSVKPLYYAGCIENNYKVIFKLALRTYYGIGCALINRGSVSCTRANAYKEKV